MDQIVKEKNMMHKWKLFIKFILLYGKKEMIIDDVMIVYTRKPELCGGTCAEVVKDAADVKLEEMGIPKEEAVQSYMLSHVYRYMGEVDEDEDCKKVQVHEDSDKEVFEKMNKEEFAGSLPEELRKQHELMWNNEDIKPPPELTTMTEKKMIRHCFGQGIKAIQLSDKLYDIYANFIFKNKEGDIADIIDTMIQVDKLQKILTAEEKPRLKGDEIIELEKTLHNLFYHTWVRTRGRIGLVKTAIRLFPDYIEEMSDKTIKGLMEGL